METEVVTALCNKGSALRDINSEKGSGEQIPQYQEMFVVVLETLQSLGGSASLEQLDREAIHRMGLPEEVIAVPHGESGHRTEVRYRLAWARTYLKIFGLLENPKRGIWRLSDKFDGNLKNIDSAKIVEAVRDQNFKEFKAATTSKLEATSAFMRYALSILQKNIGESFRFGEKDTQFDAVLVDGIVDNGKRTYVEVKTSWNGVQTSGLLGGKGVKLDQNDCLLLIVNERLTKHDKMEGKLVLQKEVPCEVLLWDYDDLLKYADQEGDYTELLSKPRKMLAEDAILHVPDEEEQKKRKRNRIEQLRQAYQSENLVLCLGAGVSHDSGIPLWEELIDELLLQMIAYKTQGETLQKSELERISQLASSNQEDSPLTQVRYIRAAFEGEEEKKDYYDLVREVLYGKNIKEQSELLDQISELCKPERNHVGVRSVITYNFDDLLERKLQNSGIKYNVVYREKDSASIKELNIYHVHGFLPQKQDENTVTDTALIFSEEDYHEVYRDAYSWSNIIQLNAFRENICLFIGSSLTDPNLRRLLDIPARSSEEPRHFAIVRRRSLPPARKEDEKPLKIYREIDDSIREKYFSSLGIKVIWIDDYQEIPRILRHVLRRGAEVME